MCMISHYNYVHKITFILLLCEQCVHYHIKKNVNNTLLENVFHHIRIM